MSSPDIYSFVPFEALEYDVGEEELEGSITTDDQHCLAVDLPVGYFVPAESLELAITEEDITGVVEDENETGII